MAEHGSKIKHEFIIRNNLYLEFLGTEQGMDANVEPMGEVGIFSDGAYSIIVECFDPEGRFSLDIDGE